MKVDSNRLAFLFFMGVISLALLAGFLYAIYIVVAH